MKKSIILSVSLFSLTAAAYGAMPTGHPAMPAAQDSKSDKTPAAEGEALNGKVLQTMNSGGYSYIYIEKKDGKKVWVAVTETQVKVGDKMSFQPGMEMPNFESKTLKRTFDSIIFSGGVINNAGSSAKAAETKKDQAASPGSKGAASAKESKISVTKATGPNAYTVEGLYSNSAKLNMKPVVVRGKVVKVSSGIMGKNWIHIQDGTGTQAKATHNLVCTSQETAAMGDVVTVSGTLAKDKDFGAGYKYSVIIEDAKFKK